MKTNIVWLRIRRSSQWQDYHVQVPRDAYVLDALEAAGAQDPSLLFGHSCHHASCGSCGVRINGREYLPCITPLAKFKNPSQSLRLEPLRNFPLVGDLLVDFQHFMRKLDLIDLPSMCTVDVIEIDQSLKRHYDRLEPLYEQGIPGLDFEFNRLENCIECGLCMSACPVVGSDFEYLGPAVLAASSRVAAEPRGRPVVEISEPYRSRPWTLALSWCL